MPRYLNVNIDGLIVAGSLGDGYSINLKWATAYVNTPGNKILYNIYMSEGIAPDFSIEFFNSPPAFVSVDGSTNVDIVDLVPGRLYHFAVRAAEYDRSFFDVRTLPPAYNGLVVYPQSLLRDDISATDIIIPLIDAEQFPDAGTAKIGAELINYTSVNRLTNDLILTSASLQRGFNNSVAEPHSTDGYDGYVYWNPAVIFWPVAQEEQNTRVFECWNRFDVDHYSFTIVDGYRQKIKDILTTDLSASDAANTGFPAYDFAGYHRTDPAMILRGDCVGSYIGGYQFCVDGYDGVGRQIRGISIQDANTQRQEVLLSLDGEPVCLVKRRWTGVTCKCMLPYNEYPEARCKFCFGSGIEIGWQQYFNPRRSDGKIMVRFDPSIDDLKATDSGLESDMQPNCWTLVIPTLKDRDFIVRFDQDGNEEFRYEILNVTRNKLFLDNSGAQKFVAQRVRRTDPIYQVSVFRDTSMFLNVINTSVESSIGFAPHSHQITTSEKITSIGQINEITSVSQGHSHVIRNGIMIDNGIGHIHKITL